MSVQFFTQCASLPGGGKNRGMVGVELEMKTSKRKQQILEASARVFALKGYFAASISDIIEEAGVARGTFYLYFTGKRQVFTEVLQQIIDAIEGMIDGVTPLDENVYSRLRNNIQRIYQFFVDNPNLSKIILTQAPGLDAESTRQLDQASYLLHDAFRRLLRRGQEDGLLREFNIDLAATMLFGGMKELLYHLVVTHEIDAPVDVVAQQIILTSATGILQPSVAKYIPRPSDTGERQTRPKRKSSANIRKGVMEK